MADATPDVDVVLERSLRLVDGAGAAVLCVGGAPSSCEAGWCRQGSSGLARAKETA